MKTDDAPDVRAHFGFTKTPFTREIAVTERWRSPIFEEPLQELHATVAARQSAVLVAPSGTGKTGLVRALLARLPEARYRTHYLKVTSLGMRDFCREIAVVAGVKKIVYTRVQGAEVGTTFSPIIQSNRKTEEDIRTSGLDWAIGRNGIYIEPDVEYIDTYRKNGEIANCAGDGRCGYTTRPELAFAYARLLSESSLDGKTYKLHGEPITQEQLTEYLNGAFGTQLVYRPMSVAEYKEERVAELGHSLGTIIAGIYDGIRTGHFDNPSDFAAVAGRPHQTWDEYFATL